MSIHDLVVPILHEYVHELIVLPLLVLVYSILIHMIPTIRLDVRISDHHQLPLCQLNSIYHLSTLFISEFISREGEVTVAIGVRDIHPEDIYWEMA